MYLPIFLPPLLSTFCIVQLQRDTNAINWLQKGSGCITQSFETRRDVSRLSPSSSSLPFIQLSLSRNSWPIRVSCETLSVCQQLKAFQNSPRTDSVSVVRMRVCVCVRARAYPGVISFSLTKLPCIPLQQADKTGLKRPGSHMCTNHKGTHGGIRPAPPKKNANTHHTHTHKSQRQTKLSHILYQSLASR